VFIVPRSSFIVLKFGSKGIVEKSGAGMDGRFEGRNIGGFDGMFELELEKLAWLFGLVRR
jgi:hypothetical protein